jgi:hypothetical protein
MILLPSVYSLPPLAFARPREIQTCGRFYSTEIALLVKDTMQTAGCGRVPANY